MKLDRRVIRSLEITLVSIMLMVTQFVVFIQIIPAYATDIDVQGIISPSDKIITKELPHAKVQAEHRMIKIHKLGEPEVTSEQSPQTLATTTTTQNVATVGTIIGLAYDRVTPPDVQVAAGPVNIMEMVNLQGEIWTKSGVIQVPPFRLSNFFGTGFDSISDPKVLFDANSQRWFASLTDITTGQVAIAVSTTSDATGSFCVYKTSSSPSVLFDQPILGVSNDKVVVSTNDYNAFTEAFLYAQYWVFNKSQMLTCSSTNFATKTVTGSSSIHPVQSLTSINTEYMVTAKHTAAGSFIRIFSVNGIPTSTTTISVTAKNINVSSILNPPSAVQKGTTFKLDTGDKRVQDAVWANNALWLAHNNRCVPSGDTTARACLHLIEINTSTMHVMQDFNYGIIGKYLFYPALRVIPSSGNLFLVFGLSSSTDYPGIEVTEQAAGDPINSLQSPIMLKAGVAQVTLTYGCVNNVCRYGDYFGAALDPTVSNGVWVAGEYGSGVLDPSGYGPAWGTRIGNFTG